MPSSPMQESRLPLLTVFLPILAHSFSLPAIFPFNFPFTFTVFTHPLFSPFLFPTVLTLPFSSSLLLFPYFFSPSVFPVKFSPHFFLLYDSPILISLPHCPVRFNTATIFPPSFTYHISFPSFSSFKLFHRHFYPDFYFIIFPASLPSPTKTSSLSPFTLFSVFTLYLFFLFPTWQFSHSSCLPSLFSGNFHSYSFLPSFLFLTVSTLLLFFPSLF